MAKPVPIGARGEVEERVKFQHTITAWQGDLPPVLSTHYMIEWMEGAGFKALLPFCEGDEFSVSTAINVDHRAATGIDAVVKAEAVLESFDGRFYTFKVSAHNGTEVIGHGTVKQAIVNNSEFEEKQRAKQVQSS
jgi:predicted thioesterase